MPNPVREFTPLPPPMLSKFKEFSAVIQIPIQDSNEKWGTVAFEFPVNGCCTRVPTLWATEEQGRYEEIRLDNLTGSRVDVSAPQGRTILLNWAC